MKDILLIVLVISTFFLSVFGYSFAQTQPIVITSTVASDYALDIQRGKESANNDVEAQENQKEIADNESVEAQEEVEAVEVVEKIEPEEAVEPAEMTEQEETVELKGTESESKNKKSDSEGDAEGSKQESGTSTDNDKK